MTNLQTISRRLSLETSGSVCADAAWLATLDATDPETAPLDAVLDLAAGAPTPYLAGFMAALSALRLRQAAAHA